MSEPRLTKVIKIDSKRGPLSRDSPNSLRVLGQYDDNLQPRRPTEPKLSCHDKIELYKLYNKITTIIAKK